MFLLYKTLKLKNSDTSNSQYLYGLYKQVIKKTENIKIRIVFKNLMNFGNSFYKYNFNMFIFILKYIDLVKHKGPNCTLSSAVKTPNLLKHQEIYSYSSISINSNH